MVSPNRTLRSAPCEKYISLFWALICVLNSRKASKQNTSVKSFMATWKNDQFHLLYPDPLILLTILLKMILL